MFQQVYPEVEEGGGTPDGKEPPAEAKNVPNIVPSEVEEIDTSEQIAPEIPAEMTVEGEEIGKEWQEKVGPLNEDPRNARTSKCFSPIGLANNFIVNVF